MIKGNLSAAIDRLRKRSEQEVEKMEHVPLNFRDVLIDNLDEEGLRKLPSCVHLALSTNCIEKMVSLPPLPALRILSLGRNQIKRILGLEAVGATLEQLWLSYNLIEKLDGLAPHCTALKVLYIGHNRVKDWNELDKLKELPRLENCSFLGNEFYEKPPPREGAPEKAGKEAEKAGKEAEKGGGKDAEKANSKEEARLSVLRRLSGLTMLDGVAVDLADLRKIGRN